MHWLFLTTISLGSVLAILELRHRLRPSSPLKLKTFNWTIKDAPNGLEVLGKIEITNPHPKMEIMVPEIDIKAILLGNENTKNIAIKTNISPEHLDEVSREDDYWQAYIVKAQKTTYASITILLTGLDTDLIKKALTNLWIEFNWVNYGPFGRLIKTDGILVPIKKPIPLNNETANFNITKECKILPIKTHMLGQLDDISQVLINYTNELIRPGDIITIGETPLAVMQGRYRSPRSIEISWPTRLLCKAFHPTSSLATACGLQTLIDLVGPTRVIIAWSIGIAGKLIGIKGLFYRLAGDQARLIDDITGTTPPYDQTIVLGPISTKEICIEISTKLGIDVAIVDVNDLGRVKILATSQRCDKELIRKALRTNPAGNSNEQTPLVLIRPS